MAALDRAIAAKDTLVVASAGTEVDWTLLAAIGIRETGFRNTDQTNGKGVGVFQIDLGKNPGVTQDQASSTSFAANWAAKYLSAAYTSFYPNEALILTGTDPWQAAAASYNHGVSGVLRDIKNGYGTDGHTTGHNYGSNVLNIRDCFR